jgi:hypothetical protein
MQGRRLLCALLLPLLLQACGDPSPSRPTATPTGQLLPERFHLPSPPPGAVDVAAAHAHARDGEEVVVRGVVGGSVKPFVAGLAAFTIVDLALRDCVDDGMHCKTPWDYCCVDPSEIARGSATVEFHEGGALLAADPRGFHGLDHLVRVIVQGTARRDERGNLEASGICPEP